MQEADSESDDDNDDDGDEEESDNKEVLMADSKRVNFYILDYSNVCFKSLLSL